MISNNRDILVLLKNEFMSEQAIEQEVENLNAIFRMTESSKSFFLAHELVDRNNITSKERKISEAIRHQELKPFRFLINKN